ASEAALANSGWGRRAIVAGVVAVVVLAGVAVGWVVWPSGDKHQTSSGSKPAASAPRSPGASGSPAPASPSASASGSGSAPASASASPPPAGSAPPALPAGWMRYRDPSGFSLYVPRGWTRSKEGSIVYFRGEGRVLGIDQTDKPQPDPVADWRGKA